MTLKRIVFAAALLAAPVSVFAESPLPSGRLDVEGLPNRYARRAAAFHRTRAVHRARRLQHGILKSADRAPRAPEAEARRRLPWEAPEPTRFERSFVARIAKAFIDTIPAGGSKQWSLRLKVILE